MFFNLDSVNVVNYFDFYVESSLHSHLFIMYNPFSVLLKLVARVLLRVFASIFIKDIGLFFGNFLFL